MNNKYRSAGTTGTCHLLINQQECSDIVKFHSNVWSKYIRSEARVDDIGGVSRTCLHSYVPSGVFTFLCYLIMAGYSHTGGSLTQYADGSAGQIPWTQSGSVHTLFAQPGFLAPAIPYLYYLPSLTHLHSPSLTLADWSVCSES